MGTKGRKNVKKPKQNKGKKGEGKKKYKKETVLKAALERKGSNNA